MVDISDERHGISSEQADELVALDAALDQLEKVNPRQRQIVELRYFGGLSLEEISEVLRVSPIIVEPAVGRQPAGTLDNLFPFVESCWSLCWSRTVLMSSAVCRCGGLAALNPGTSYRNFAAHGVNASQGSRAGRTSRATSEIDI